MGRFLDPLDVRIHENGVTRTLTHELRYASDEGRVYTVHAGFETDFASTPRFMWRVCPPSTGRYVWGAVIHDYFYRVPSEDITRSRADEIFLEIMKNSGVPLWKRQAMHKAVRLFGGSSYQKRQSTQPHNG